MGKMRMDIANKICKMCVNKDTQIPFPISMILKAMDDLKVSIKLTGAKDVAKKQALMIVKELEEK